MTRRIPLTLFAVGAAFTWMGCEGGSSPVPSPGGQRVLARNVVVGATAQQEGVDPNLKVLAQNVEVSNTANALAATDLQTALDNELAVDLATLLPGTTWTIQNRTADAEYNNFPGEISFSADGKVTLTGRFGAGGLVSGSDPTSFCNIPLEVSYEVLGNAVLYLSARTKDRGGSAETNQAIAPTVVSRKRDQLILVGSGGCGALGEDRVSVLTRKQ